MTEGGSVSGPFFTDTADEVVRRLEGDPSPEARELKRRALEVAEKFRRWQTERPASGEKLAAISLLFELREATDALTSRTGGAGGR